MNSNLRLLVPVIAAAAALSCSQVLAQNHTLKAGVVRYDAHSRTNGISGIGIPPGADAKVGDATTLLLTYEYEIKPNVGIELAVGIPPRIKARATGSVAFLGEVLSARNVAPTLLLNYHVGRQGDLWRPYFGLGINYTRFTDVTTPYGWDVKLRESVGMAAHVGLNLALAKDWGLFASVARVDVKSRLVATGAVVLESKIDFRPWTYETGFFHRF